MTAAANLEVPTLQFRQLPRQGVTQLVDATADVDNPAAVPRAARCMVPTSSALTAAQSVMRVDETAATAAIPLGDAVDVQPTATVPTATTVAATTSVALTGCGSRPRYDSPGNGSDDWVAQQPLIVDAASDASIKPQQVDEPVGLEGHATEGAHGSGLDAAAQGLSAHSLALLQRARTSQAGCAAAAEVPVPTPAPAEPPAPSLVARAGQASASAVMTFILLPLWQACFFVVVAGWRWGWTAAQPHVALAYASVRHRVTTVAAEATDAAEASWNRMHDAIVAVVAATAAAAVSWMRSCSWSNVRAAVDRLIWRVDMAALGSRFEAFRSRHRSREYGDEVNEAEWEKVLTGLGTLAHLLLPVVRNVRSTNRSFEPQRLTPVEVRQSIQQRIGLVPASASAAAQPGTGLTLVSHHAVPVRGKIAPGGQLTSISDQMSVISECVLPVPTAAASTSHLSFLRSLFGGWTGSSGRPEEDVADAVAANAAAAAAAAAAIRPPEVATTVTVGTLMVDEHGLPVPVEVGVDEGSTAPLEVHSGATAAPSIQRPPQSSTLLARGRVTVSQATAEPAATAPAAWVAQTGTGQRLLPAGLEQPPAWVITTVPMIPAAGVPVVPLAAAAPAAVASRSVPLDSPAAGSSGASAPPPRAASAPPAPRWSAAARGRIVQATTGITSALRSTEARLHFPPLGSTSLQVAPGLPPLRLNIPPGAVLVCLNPNTLLHDPLALAQHVTNAQAAKRAEQVAMQRRMLAAAYRSRGRTDTSAWAPAVAAGGTGAGGTGARPRSASAPPIHRGMDLLAGPKRVWSAIRHPVTALLDKYVPTEPTEDDVLQYLPTAGADAGDDLNVDDAGTGTSGRRRVTIVDEPAEPSLAEAAAAGASGGSSAATTSTTTATTTTTSEPGSRGGRFSAWRRGVVLARATRWAFLVMAVADYFTPDTSMVFLGRLQRACHDIGEIVEAGIHLLDWSNPSATKAAMIAILVSAVLNVMVPQRAFWLAIGLFIMTIKSTAARYAIDVVQGLASYWLCSLSWRERSALLDKHWASAGTNRASLLARYDVIADVVSEGVLVVAQRR